MEERKLTAERHITVTCEEQDLRKKIYAVKKIG